MQKEEDRTTICYHDVKGWSLMNSETCITWWRMNGGNILSFILNDSESFITWAWNQIDASNLVWKMLRSFVCIFSSMILKPVLYAFHALFILTCSMCKIVLNQEWKMLISTRLIRSLCEKGRNTIWELFYRRLVLYNFHFAWNIFIVYTVYFTWNA